MRVEVVRLGHRPERDKRMTTHVCLTARAFGADRVYVDAGDNELEERMARVAEQFGGEFEVRTGVSPKGLIKSSRATVVHLTMYGENVYTWGEDRWEDLRQKQCVLVVVGSTKVPREYYEMADINAAVGNQPHSEVAALAVFLDHLTGGEPLRNDLGGRMTVVPQERGKLVIDSDDGDGD
jgi:tRNA (cytidine56-2'-O)-methyltransferase